MVQNDTSTKLVRNSTSLSGPQDVGGTVILIREMKIKFSLLPQKAQRILGDLTGTRNVLDQRETHHSTHNPLSELVTKLHMQRGSEKCHPPMYQKMSQCGYEFTP